jgi:HEAT repeat protein
MMADKHGVLGARSADSSHGDDASSEGAGPAIDNREAYEEDWYRSLRALAERQQALAGGEEEDEEDEPRAPEPEESVVHSSAFEESALDEPPLGPLAARLREAERRAAESARPDAADETAEAISRVLEAATLPASELEPPSGRDGSPPRLHVVAEPEEPVGDLTSLGEEAEEEPAAEDTDEGSPTALERVARRVEELAASAREPMEPPDGSGGEVELGPVTWPGAPESDLLDEAGAEAWAEERVDEPEGHETLEEPYVDEADEELVAIEEASPGAVDETLEPAEHSLTSADPRERAFALHALATKELSEAETHRVEAMLLDPEADIRMSAIRALARRPDRVSPGAVWQSLQDPTDEVRAVAVELAASRGDAWQIAPLLAARDAPLTQAAALRLLPEIVASAPVDDRVLGRILGAVGDLDPGPLGSEEVAIRQLALALGSRRILGALSWPDVPRLGAIRLLSHDRSPDVLRELAAYETDPVDEIREFAVAARTELAMAETVREPLQGAQGAADEEESERITSLARALVDDDPTVRHLALSGLAGMDRPAIAAWAQEAIGSGDASQLSLAASVAQMLRLVEGAADILDAAAELPVDARHSLLDALTSFVMPPDQLAGLLPQVREPHQAEAIRMLWQVGGPPLLPYLRSYLDDPSIAVRQAVLDVFAESGDATALDVARVSLESDVSPVVRARAVRMLAQVRVAPPTSTIVVALSDPDPEVRATAIETLPDVSGAEAVDALTSSLRDQDDRVRLAAAKRLAAQAADPELVWSSLRQAPETGRGDIISSFERVRSGSLTQIALERLRSPDLEERVLAVEVCGWGASPGCVEGAIQALHDPSAIVRRTATVSLGRLRDPAATSALGKALGDPDAEVRMGVVRALGVIDDEAVLGLLVTALNDPVEEVRDVGSQVLTEWSSPAVARRLAGVLAVPRLREAATELLTRIGKPAVELLIDVLMQHNPAVVPTVGELLRGISEPEEFLARLDGIEPERRLRGLEALGAIGGPEAADALLRSVADPDERIRARSAQLLAELRDPRSREALTGLLRDPIPGVQAAAQEALSRLPD